MIQTLFSLLFINLNFALATTIHLEWSLDWVQNGNPDALFSRPVIGVNGEWPIPSIHAQVGDVLQLKVVNLLNESSGIHFHGLFQKGTNYYDGAQGITDCGIAPNGGEITYHVHLDQVGSFWVHSHHAGQYPDGLRTALIIHGESPYHFEEDFTLALSDWYHDTHAVNFFTFNSPLNPDGVEPVPNSVLVNDKPENLFSLAAGKSYKFRLVSMATYAMINVWIEGLDFQIIETDGIDCEAYTASILQIAPAQRYSILVAIPENTQLNYRIHFELVTSMFMGDLPEIYQPEAIAQLVINSNFDYFNIRSDEKPDANSFDEMYLHPLQKEAPFIPDSSTRLDVIFNLFSDGLNHGTFNNSVYEFPNVPALFTALSMGEDASNVKAYGPWTHSAVLQPNSVIELILVTHDKEGAHPFHLHGHTFQVVAKSFKADFSYAKLNDLVSMNPNPLLRDTVNLPKFGWVAIRFKADNPGIWFFHCHIQWHVEAGLAGQFIESPILLQQQRASLPADVIENCKKQNIKMEGNAAGFPDLVTFDGLKESPKHRLSKPLTTIILQNKNQRLRKVLK